MAVIPHPAGPVAPDPIALAREPVPWVSRAAEFAAEVVGPLGLVLDRAGTPAARRVSAPLAEFLALAAREGYMALTDPARRGGAAPDRAAEYAVLETLAAADAGLAAVLSAAALASRIAGERADGCGCIVATTDGPPALRRDGNGWRLGGATRGPVTGAALADYAAIACADADRGFGHVVAIVPLQRAGVRRSAPAPEPEAGLRGRLPARLGFDDVRLERDEILGGDRGGARLALSLGAAELLAAAVGCAGVGRAAYAGAARWRSERGLDAGAALARMRWELDMARGAVRCAHEREYGRLDAGEAMRPPHAVTAHDLAASTAVSLARRAITLCGPDAAGDAGVAHLDGTRFHPHKLLRDAIAASAARPGRIRPAAPRAAQPQRIGSMEWAT
jgi:alkylation response protein AidB-like acyl-CoA dehydrogenase